MKKLTFLYVFLIFIFVSCYVGTSLEDMYLNAVTFKSSSSTSHSKYVQKVAIENGFNSNFYVTTDGSDPTKSSTYYKSYEDEFLLFNSTDLKLIFEEIGSVPVFSYNVPGDLDGMITITSKYYSSSQQQVTITGNEKNVYFHYTLDGSIPDQNDQYLYSSSQNYVSKTLLVDNGTTISVRGRLKDSYHPAVYSPVVTYTAPIFVPVNVPTITGSYYSSTQKNMTINCDTYGAEIYYTTDNTVPDIDDYKYTGSFVANNGTTIKAVAYKDGYFSEATTYVVSTTVNMPIITDAYYSSNLKSVTITSATEDSIIYYTTDGTTPDISDCIYSDSFVVANNTTVKARAYRDGYWSEIASYTVIIPTINKPTFSVGSYSNSYMRIYLSNSTTGAIIYYTTDGSDPNINSYKYSGTAIYVYDGSTIKARAYKDGYWSEITSYHVITSVGNPSITGSYYSDSFMNITLKCDTPDAVIYYTTDGTTPNEYDNVYEGAFAVANGVTLKAIAKRGYYWSDVETYVISTVVAAPTITSEYYSSTEKNITINCNTIGSTIYYTTDGTTPNTSNYIYKGSFPVKGGTIIKSRAYSNGYWSEEVSYTATIPNIDTPNIVGSSYTSSSVRIYIFCDTEDVSIYYTTDGTVPDTSDYKYTNSFVVTNGKTVIARAYKDGYWSELDSHEVLTSVSIPIVTSTYYSSTKKTVSISCNTEGAYIYYTIDGTTPDTGGKYYYSPFTVDDGTTVKARAHRDGYWSEEVTYNVSIPIMYAPTITGTYYSCTHKNLTINCNTEGAIIYYTTNGAIPNIYDNEYVGPFSVADSTTVKVRAYKDGYWSETSTYVVTIPTMYTPTITSEYYYSETQEKFTIGCNTEGATIFYTVDGTIPDINSNIYLDYLIASNNTTIKARAYKEGYWSDVMTYVVSIPAMYIPIVEESFYSNTEKKITISSNTEGATIYYTTNGSIPDISDNCYQEPFAVQNNTTVIARAYLNGYWSDPAIYVVFVPTIHPPVIKGSYCSNTHQKINFSCSTEGAIIYFTDDGTIPDINDNYYDYPFDVQNGAILTARAYKDGYWSDTTVYAVMTTLSAPSINQRFYSSDSDLVVIQSDVKDAEIFYTLDGTEPTEYSDKYVNELIVEEGVTVKAKTYRDGYWSTLSSSAIVRSFDMPVITSSYYAHNTELVTIESSLENATIYYTTDGTSPDENSNIYVGPFTVTANLTNFIKAKVYFNEEWSFTSNYTLYTTSRKGPAGGYICYDCDADNDSGNSDGLISTECGWRFIEVASNNIGGVWVKFSDEYIFVTGTSLSIGSGKLNTEKIIEACGDISSAAKLCDDYVFIYENVIFDDWFLPSAEELALYHKYTNYSNNELTSQYYWTSSSWDSYDAMVFDTLINYSLGLYYRVDKKSLNAVRPVRYFL